MAGNVTTDSIFLCVNRNLTRTVAARQPTWWAFECLCLCVFVARTVRVNVCVGRMYVFDHALSIAKVVLPSTPFCW